MVETIVYAEAKMNLGDGMVTIFNHYNCKLSDLEGLGNEVVCGEIKKANALTTIDEIITSNKITFTSLQNYFVERMPITEPSFSLATISMTNFVMQASWLLLKKQGIGTFDPY